VDGVVDCVEVRAVLPGVGEAGGGDLGEGAGALPAGGGEGVERGGRGFPVGGRGGLGVVAGEGRGVVVLDDVAAVPVVRFYREGVVLVGGALVVTVDQFNVNKLVFVVRLDVLSRSDVGHVAPVIRAIDICGRLG